MFFVSKIVKIHLFLMERAVYHNSITQQYSQNIEVNQSNHRIKKNMYKTYSLYYKYLLIYVLEFGDFEREILLFKVRLFGVLLFGM